MNKCIWVITGVSSGLGKALAEAVMASGDFVIGTFRSVDQVAAFNAENAGRGWALQLDMTDANGREPAVREIMERFGRVDVLVNNAGYGLAGAIEETSEAELRKLFEVNFFAPFLLTKQFLPLFRAQGSGHILQISSHGGFKAFPGFGAYNASKFALEGFSEALAQEVAPLGIRLTLVEPGPFRTKFAGASFQMAQTELADYATTAGAFRARMQSVDGTQEGDPDKAAQALVSIVRSENPPLRLPLGKVAVASLRSKLADVTRDLEAYSSVAESVVFVKNE